ncbi:MAG TPA: response regulator, partial [Nitrososphaeraceae archaeon]|nr:response regulator [Nitrososphaeraceae archaeon]
RYYSIFINTMAAIARSFDAKVIKNTGTSLVYYFPKTSDSSNLSAFKDVIECGLTMMIANKVINMKLKEEGLPSLQYKISADYGRVEMARSVSSPNTDDLFGSTMNVCAKINSMAPPNGMVVGSDLYHIAKKSSSVFDNYYHFKLVGEYSIDASFTHQYPVYSVQSKNRNNTLDLDKQISKLKPVIQIQHEYISTQKQIKKSFKLPNINYNRYQQQQQQLPQQQKDGNNILLVDDEPDILLTYKTFLLSAHEGYNVDAFTDSQKALQQFAQVNSPSYYDLVVMDVRMPGLNGLQLYYRLKAISPDIKVLFVSAVDAAQEMISILPGVKLDDVVKKPVDEEQFLYKVRKMTLAA